MLSILMFAGEPGNVDDVLGTTRGYWATPRSS